jgi:hypothetical protein
LKENPFNYLRPNQLQEKSVSVHKPKKVQKPVRVLMSVMQTLKKRVSNPRERFKEVLEQITINPETDLYQALFETNSS